MKPSAFQQSIPQLTIFLICFEVLQLQLLQLKVETHSASTIMLRIIRSLFAGSQRSLLLDIITSRFGTKKRVRELEQVTISLTEQKEQAIKELGIEYVKIKNEVKNIGWQTMDFDRLCSLQPQILNQIEIEIKKDKFNVPDQQFYSYGTVNLRKQIMGQSNQNKNTISMLNEYYRKIYHLLVNQHSSYSQLQKIIQQKTGYLDQMYILNLTKDINLNNLITYFINNLAFPQELEQVAQASLVKQLLVLKRQLMIQGVYFETKKQDKARKQKIKQIKATRKTERKQKQKQQLMTEQGQLLQLPEAIVQNQDEMMLDAEEQLEEYTNFKIMQQDIAKYQHQVKVIKVLGYQYQFWVDVKHNRNKNGVQDDYVIEEREIDNPNRTIVLLQKYPKIKLKYIVHKRKRKDYSMHFCIKANLLIKINNQHIRKIKIEWDGPSNKPSSEEHTSYRVIDYENIMNGNSTIKPVFNF